MQGFHVGRKDEFQQQTKNSAVTLNLIAQIPGLEIMIEEVQPNAPCGIIPGESEELLEFFYILEGSLELSVESEQIVLEKGDYFYVYNLKESIPAISYQGLKMLYFSSQPVYNYIEQHSGEFAKVLEQVEAKDVYTFNHGNRVQSYCLKIAHKLNLAKTLFFSLAISSRFHDLGKIQVPDEILNKPGRLATEEFEIIKRHPEESGKILEGKFKNEVANIVVQHHERLDGSGYPKGLKEEEICLEAKIIAVADTYDAMTSDRAYRKGAPASKAIEELKSLIGIHYDEKIVLALEEILKEEGLI